ncbi:hypothetical protein PCE1_002921 [Barthelona sp. PCE]
MSYQNSLTRRFPYQTKKSSYKHGTCEVIVLCRDNSSELFHELENYVQNVQEYLRENCINVYITDVYKDEPIDKHSLKAVIKLSPSEFLVVIGDKNVEKNTVSGRINSRLVHLSSENWVTYVLEENKDSFEDLAKDRKYPMTLVCRILSGLGLKGIKSCFKTIRSFEKVIDDDESNTSVLSNLRASGFLVLRSLLAAYNILLTHVTIVEEVVPTKGKLLSRSEYEAVCERATNPYATVKEMIITTDVADKLFNEYIFEFALELIEKGEQVFNLQAFQQKSSKKTQNTRVRNEEIETWNTYTRRVKIFLMDAKDRFRSKDKFDTFTDVPYFQNRNSNYVQCNYCNMASRKGKECDICKFVTRSTAPSFSNIPKPIIPTKQEPTLVSAIANKVKAPTIKPMIVAEQKQEIGTIPVTQKITDRENAYLQQINSQQLHVEKLLDLIEKQEKKIEKLEEENLKLRLQSSSPLFYSGFNNYRDFNGYPPNRSFSDNTIKSDKLPVFPEVDRTSSYSEINNAGFGGFDISSLN